MALCRSNLSASVCHASCAVGFEATRSVHSNETELSNIAKAVIFLCSHVISSSVDDAMVDDVDVDVVVEDLETGSLPFDGRSSSPEATVHTCA